MDNKEYGIELNLVIDKFKSKMQEAQRIVNNAVDEFKTGFELDIDVKHQELDEMIAKLKSLVPNVKLDIDEDGKIDIAQKNIGNLKHAIANMTQKGRAEFQQLLTDIQKMSEEVNKGGSAFGQFGSEIKRAIADLKATLSELVRIIAQALNPKNMATNFVNKLKEIGKKAKESAKNLFSMHSNTKKLGSGLSKHLNKGVSSLKKFALSLFGVQTAYRMVSKAASAYLSYDQELSKSIQNTWAGLGSFLAPVLEALVSLFQKFLAYVNAAAKALTGVDFVARANAKAMQNAGKSAKSASQAMAGFDELQNLDKSSGGGEVSQIEIPDIDTSGIEGIVEKIKALFEAGDYESIGILIGNKITEALKSIPWSEIQAEALNIGTNIASFLNGAINGINWETMGNTIAGGINTAINFAYGFVTEFEWGTFGQSIGTYLSTSFNNIEWKKLAETISGGITGMFDVIINALQNINWVQVATSIETFFTNIDWGGIVSRVFELIGSAIGSLLLLLGTWISDAWNSIVGYFDYWIEQAEETGGDIWIGILAGIVNAFIGIGEWLKENVFDPFIDGFKELFGIHSPSTVMADLGCLLIDGLKEGIGDIWDKVKEKFDDFAKSIGNFFKDLWEKVKGKAQDGWDGMKNVFSNAGTFFKDTFEKAWKKVKDVFSSGGKIFDGIKEGIENAFKKIVNKLIDGINKVVAKPFQAINKMLNTIRNTDILGVKPFKGLWKQDPISIPKIPKLKVGTDDVLSEGLAYLHRGEKVVPADVVKGGYTGESSVNSEETNSLLRQLINLVENKDYTPYITVDDIGRASVKYIKKKSRIEGEAII